jgi:hypothetical protein
MADPVGDATQITRSLADWAARLERLARELREAIDRRVRDEGDDSGRH